MFFDTILDVPIHPTFTCSKLTMLTAECFRHLPVQNQQWKHLSIRYIVPHPILSPSWKNPPSSRFSFPLALTSVIFFFSLYNFKTCVLFLLICVFFRILGQFWQHFGTAPCRLEIQSWCGLNSWLMVISFINEVEEFEDLKRFLNEKIKHSISQRFCHPVLIKMGTLLVLFNNRTKKQFCEFDLVPSPM